MMNNGGLKSDQGEYPDYIVEKSPGRARSMRPPRIPPLAMDIVQNALSSLQGMEFAEIVSCPVCSGTDFQGYDRKAKKFAVLREQTGERIITVRVKRFRCRHCGNLCYADEPYYPDTRIGSPVIDLFSSLSATMPPSRAARIIEALGIVVDRTTWRNYSGRSFGNIPVVDVFGMRLPLCIMQLSEIALRSGDYGHADPMDVIAACGYPSRQQPTTGTPGRIT
jgi:hypothetical protein